MTEDAQPARSAQPSLIALAYRVVRGELTEAQAIEIVRKRAEEDGRHV